MAAVNRLAELQQQGAGGSVNPVARDSTIIDIELTESTSRFNEIKQKINEIVLNTDQIERLKDQDRTADSVQRQEILNQIERITDGTHGLAASIKNSLTQIKEENNKIALANPNSNRVSAMLGLYQLQIRSFHEVTNNFQAVIISYLKLVYIEQTNHTDTYLHFTISLYL